MDDVLLKMKAEVAKHADVISKLLKADVQVVDGKLNRVASRGPTFEGVETDRFVVGRVFEEVVATGEKQVIRDPGRHFLCTTCDKRNECGETFEMSTPILLDGQVIGVLGFVCFTDAQKEYICSNFDVFSNFLDQMAGLISLKAAQLMENERMLAVTRMMNDVVDKIDEGVLVLDKNRNVTRMNAVVKDLFACRDNGDYEFTLEKQGESTGDNDVYKLQCAGREYDVTGKYFTFHDATFNEVFIFREVNALKADVMALMSANEKIGLGRLLGHSRAVLELKDTIKNVASTPSSVMIFGESGTGKELVARALHEEGDRADHPFVAVNCGAIPENLLESELFGYVRGAFTGADPRGKVGKFELAHNGTLFLDEIGDMPLHIQVKLLRVLEEREIVRLGSNTPLAIDVRVVAATNKDLEKLIGERAFREDLFYRLNVIPIRVGALRNREGDIRLLARFFFQRYSKIFDKAFVGVEEAFWVCLERYSWPGNVRELQNTIEYVVNVTPDKRVVTRDLLPGKVGKREETHPAEELNLEIMERKIIRKALDRYGSGGQAKKEIAKKMGIGVATLYRKMKKHGLGTV